MPDYSNTIIYKICCKDPSITDIYIGSTCNFRARKYLHKSCCNNEKCKDYNYNVYQFIREHGNWDNWTMIMIHEASVENKFQKEKLEREFIEEMKPTLNSCIPTRTRKEYLEANKQKLTEYHKEYREVNKEKLAEQKKEKIDCECGGKYTKSNKSIHMKSKKHQDYINSK